MIPTVQVGNGQFLCERDPGEINMPPGYKRTSIAEDEYAILQIFAADKTVLEIGTGLGISSRALSSAKKLTTVDIDPWVWEAIHPELAAMGITCLRELPEGGFADLVFIDAHHTYDAFKKDLEAAREFLNMGGVILAHDMHLAGMQEAARSVGFVPYILPTTGHIGLMWV